MGRGRAERDAAFSLSEKGTFTDGHEGTKYEKRTCRYLSICTHGTYLVIRDSSNYSVHTAPIGPAPRAEGSYKIALSSPL